MVSPENITFPDSLKFNTKINNRVVYGGGGIMPDFFIPIDTAMVSDFYSRMMRRGILNNFGVEYTNRHREHLQERYPDVDSFIETFTADQALIDELLAYASEHDLEPEEEMDEDAKQHIRNQVKALIARNLFDFAAFTQVIMQQNDAFLRAVEIIEDGTFERLNIRY